MTKKELFQYLKHVPDDEEMCVLIWTKEDVFTAAEEMVTSVSPDEVSVILNRIERHHDATMGVSWENIRQEIAEVCGMIDNKPPMRLASEFGREYYLLTDSQYVSDVHDSLGLEDEGDITLFVLTNEGEYLEVWGSNESFPLDHTEFKLRYKGE